MRITTVGWNTAKSCLNLYVYKRPHSEWFHSYEMSRISKSVETESWLGLPRARGLGRKWGVTIMGRGFLFEVMKVC